MSLEVGGHPASAHGVDHFLGTPLARVEVEITLTALPRRLLDLRLVVPASDLT